VSVGFGENNPIYVVGAQGRERFCHTRPASARVPALALAQVVDQLRLEPLAGVVVEDRSDVLVDACNGEVLFDLRGLPRPQRWRYPGPVTQLPRREDADRAVFEGLFRGGPRRSDLVLVDLAGQTAAEALRPALLRARFAAVTGVALAERDLP
jgi:hypothetical protein